MTDRAEIERLLKRTGRTLEGLPTQDDYWYSDDYVDRNEEIGMMMYRSGFKRNEPYIMHQSDVIELLVGALRDALKEAEKQKELVELNRFLLGAADKALEEAEKHVPKWISVEEQSEPKEDGEYWCHGYWIGSGRKQTETAEYLGEWKISNAFVLTHWMPLSEPPKEGE